MEPQIRFCASADGTRIGYAVNGSPGNPPMIAVRGWGYVLEAYWAHPWGQKFEEVEGRHRFVAEYDRRGCGASQRDVSNLSLAAHVADLSAVADALNLERFDLMGWHDGCAIAASYAAQNADRVARLVLCSPFGAAAGTAWGDAVVQTAGMIRADWSLARRALATVFFPSGSTDMQRWWSRVMRDGTSSDVAARHYEEFIAGLDITAELPRIQAPTLVLHFGDVHMTAVEASRAVAASIPGARFVPLEGESEAAADRFEDLVLPFLDEGREQDARPLPSGMTAILFADIAESTAMTERLGDAAFREKARRLDGALRAIIRGHAGAPIDGKLLGDGVLATFTSASQAIAAAMACGKAGEDGGLALHVGLHAGDVIREENNVFGGAVNIAARICALSGPGEILVSDVVRGMARTSAGVAFEDRGERALKGISEPLRVFSVRGG